MYRQLCNLLAKSRMHVDTSMDPYARLLSEERKLPNELEILKDLPETN